MALIDLPDTNAWIGYLRRKDVALRSLSGQPQYGAVNAVCQIQPGLTHGVKGRSNGRDATLFLGSEQDAGRSEQGDVSPDGFCAGRAVVQHDDGSGILDGQR